MKSDNDLRRDVERELEWDPSVDAGAIGVAVKNSVVSLSGQVSSYADKVSAERIAKRVAGVAGLANDIEVKYSSERTDTDIAQAAALALQFDTTLPPGQVKVIVERGWLTLEGKVDWYYQKSAAEDAVRHLAGVKGIVNRIAVTPQVIPGEVRKQIEEAFKRSAQVDARQIAVEAQGNKVILRGTVRSWAEKDEAEMAAWAAPGISEVDNRLNITYASG
ncbi:MAG TPA: BON domain-containing protein [Candidatus Binataceae bacterium]|nr:BON domain-containing protein [Candidatus Binataceae bacterium]